jgi:hypothetical protein
MLLPPAISLPLRSWPEPTAEHGAAVKAVRELSWSFRPEEWDRKWPRKRCQRCQGKGWYWLDPYVSTRGWDSRRPCLTIGVVLRRPTEPRHRPATAASSPTTDQGLTIDSVCVSAYTWSS